MSDLLNVISGTFRKTFIGVLSMAALLFPAVVLLLSPPAASSGAVHNAGDYSVFAKAAGDGGTDDPKVYEPVCDDANDKQADVSGSNSRVYGRIHSNADLAISGSDNRFYDTVSPNSELTYGVNDGPSSHCQLQAEDTNVYDSGLPLNIAGNGNPGDIEGPYQIGPKGWPGNLADFLDANGMTFGNAVSQLLPGAVCDVGSLTHSGEIEITPADEGKVICNGDDPITISDSGLGTPQNPYRITMVSHGLIEISGSNHYLAPATHVVLAWTDQRFDDEATSIKISGNNVNVLARAIIFSPRSGQDVSGSNSDLLCIQMVGQGALKLAGSNVTIGPLAPGCEQQPTDLPYKAYLPMVHRQRLKGENQSDNREVSRRTRQRNRWTIVDRRNCQIYAVTTALLRTASSSIRAVLN